MVSVPYAMATNYANDAQMVTGNTVEKDVPANAVFTDSQQIELFSYDSTNQSITL